MRRLFATYYDLVFLVVWFVPVSVAAFWSMLVNVPSLSWLSPVFRYFVPYDPWSGPSKARFVGSLVVGLLVYASSYQLALHVGAGGTFGERMTGLGRTITDRGTRTAWLLFAHFVLNILVFRIAMTSMWT